MLQITVRIVIVFLVLSKPNHSFSDVTIYRHNMQHNRFDRWSRFDLAELRNSPYQILRL